MVVREASPSPVYGAALLMRLGFTAPPGFKSPSLRSLTWEPVLAAQAPVFVLMIIFARQSGVTASVAWGGLPLCPAGRVAHLVIHDVVALQADRGVDTMTRSALDQGASGVCLPTARSWVCDHVPPCPAATAADRDAARTVAAHPEQGWSLLCNGVVLFDDTGELLPDGRPIPPHGRGGVFIANQCQCGPGLGRGGPAAPAVCGTVASGQGAAA
jgi:Family of unknown function (DUF5999)